MRSVWRGVVVAAVVLPVVALSLCSKPTPTSRPTPLAPEVAAVVSAFTDGTISRESAIRVVFNEPIGSGAALNAPLDDSPFSFDPAVEGVAVWAAPTRLEFRPSERLDEGRPYLARVDMEKLLGDQAPAPHFEFGFATMEQSFSVSIEGLLAAEASNIARQRLSGQLVTADVDSDAGIGRVLAAAQDGRPLEIAWDHQADPLTHAFVVQGIVRQDEPSALTLRWDGAPIGVEEAAASEIAVPTLDTFAVSQARAVQGQEQYVELRFTDPLLPDQNLRGLIGIGNRSDLRLAIQGNIVEVYGTAGFSGKQTLRIEAGVRNSLGYRMRERQELSVRFEQEKPQLRFASDGVIVPTSANLTVPVEAVNLRAVTVEATRVAEGNLPQFLQVNDLAGQGQLNRVGRVVWRKTLPLEPTADKRDRWIAGGLDLSSLVEDSPGGLYRLSLSFDRRHVIWPCGDDVRTSPSRRQTMPPTWSRRRATGTRGRTTPTTGSPAIRVDTTHATPATTSTSTTTTSAPAATFSLPTSA